MALNAAVDPTLMMQIHPVMHAQRPTARRGRADSELTYMRVIKLVTSLYGGKGGDNQSYVSEEIREWQSLVSGKGPGETRCRGQEPKRCANNQCCGNGGHHGCSRVGLGGRIEDFNEVVAGGAVQRIIHISDTEQESKDNGKPKRAV